LSRRVPYLRGRCARIGGYDVNAGLQSTARYGLVPKQKMLVAKLILK
jgi:hypothetical protein